MEWKLNIKKTFLIFFPLLMIIIFISIFLFIKIKKSKERKLILPVKKDEIEEIVEDKGTLLFFLKKSQTAIFPVAKGELEVGSSLVSSVKEESGDSQIHTRIKINSEKGIEFIYLLSGRSLKGPGFLVDILEKEIALSGEEPLRFYQDADLVIQAKNSEGEQIELFEKDFQQRK